MALQNSIYAPTPFAVNKGGTGNSAALTNGQLWVGNTGNTPSVSTITPGAGISITNGPGVITIASGMTTQFVETEGPIILSPSTLYIIFGPVLFMTPMDALPGDTYSIMGTDAESTFTVQVPVSYPQNIYYNGIVGTSLSTTASSPGITIVCMLGPPTMLAPQFFGVLSTNGAIFTCT